MIFYMHSKTFLEEFLQNEEDWVILDSYYVLASLRIRTRGKYKTIQNAKSIFSPSAAVLYQEDRESAKAQYMKQIDSDAKVYLATLIQGCIKKNYNIIFLCSKNESKGHYLEYIAEYVKETFHFPMYDYRKFIRGKEPTEAYDAEAVLSFCKSVLQKHAKEDSMAYEMRLKNLSKKKMIKELRKFSIYPSGKENKEELRDLLRYFQRQS